MGDTRHTCYNSQNIGNAIAEIKNKRLPGTTGLNTKLELSTEHFETLTVELANHRKDFRNDWCNSGRSFSGVSHQSYERIQK
jgi:hypothetical protein